ncbi:MAG TPA: hypothetical protein VI306_09530 [Pyrinomonadaceae bacterium]
MTPQMCLDDETKENDVRYGIDDCRKRLRSQRTTLRSQHDSPTEVGKDARTESYAELLTVSMSQGLLSKLVECLLGPTKVETKQPERTAERDEAVIR